MDTRYHLLALALTAAIAGGSHVVFSVDDIDLYFKHAWMQVLGRPFGPQDLQDLQDIVGQEHDMIRAAGDYCIVRLGDSWDTYMAEPDLSQALAATRIG
jgi:hypothetical protein